MAAPKRTRTEREMARAEAARLEREGWTEAEIARHQGVAPSQVHYDLQKVRDRYRESAQQEHAEMLGEKRAALRDVLREAYKAWRWSLGEAAESLAEQVINRVNTSARLNQPL